MMALISDLNQVLAATLDFELKTVAIYSRRLREAGLISKKGRGRGAAHATPLDGARLLIALLASVRAVMAPEVVRDFGNLVMARTRDDLIHLAEPNEQFSSKQDKLAAFSLEGACGLPRHHKFEDALAAILSGFGDESFSKAYSEATSMIEPINLPRPPVVDVSITDKSLHAEIRMGAHRYFYSTPKMSDTQLNELMESGRLGEAQDEFNAIARKHQRGFRRTSVLEIDHLRSVALVINGRELNFPVVTTA